MTGAGFIHLSLVLGAALALGCNDRPPETPEGSSTDYGATTDPAMGSGGYAAAAATPGAMTPDPILGTAGTTPGGTVAPGSTAGGGMPGSTTPGAPLPGSGGGGGLVGMSTGTGRAAMAGGPSVGAR